MKMAGRWLLRGGIGGRSERQWFELAAPILNIGASFLSKANWWYRRRLEVVIVPFYVRLDT